MQDTGGGQQGRPYYLNLQRAKRCVQSFVLPPSFTEIPE